ncbi:hypothetical protein [Corynebacterium dentalis]|uniref:hypothetical protein n=1 Tax=Corynebacterium dentalis TaxID=2014528 RepID=UPI00370D1537
MNWIETASTWIGQANWGDVPTWIAAVVAVPSVSFAALQMRATARQNQITSRQEADALRPIVFASLVEGEASWQAIDFVVRNVGASPAYDISIEMVDYPELTDWIHELPFWETGIFKNGLPILGPGQELRMFADSSNQRADEPELKDQGKVRVKYKSVNGFEFQDELNLDFGFLKGALRMNIFSIHHVGKALDSIDKTLRKKR